MLLDELRIGWYSKRVNRDACECAARLCVGESELGTVIDDVVVAMAGVAVVIVVIAVCDVVVVVALSVVIVVVVLSCIGVVWLWW